MSDKVVKIYGVRVIVNGVHAWTKKIYDTSDLAEAQRRADQISRSRGLPAYAAERPR